MNQNEKKVQELVFSAIYLENAAAWESALLEASYTGTSIILADYDGTFKHVPQETVEKVRKKALTRYLGIKLFCKATYLAYRKYLRRT